MWYAGDTCTDDQTGRQTGERTQNVVERSSASQARAAQGSYQPRRIPSSTARPRRSSDHDDADKKAS